MQHFKKEITDIFRLHCTPGIIRLGETTIRNNPRWKNYIWDGLLPAQETHAQIESTKDHIPPPENIIPLIQEVSEKRMEDYLNKVLPLAIGLLPKQEFLLLTIALDGYLERRGFEGTLGAKYCDITKKHALSPQLLANVQELIQRRNDVAHGGGVISNNYRNATKYPLLKKSQWITDNGMPGSQEKDHTFSLKYLYFATSAAFELANNIP